MTRWALLLLLAGCAASLPQRLGDPDPAVQEKAEEEWEALAPAQQFEVMRRGLRGREEERRVAALALDPLCLTLEEIRLQMSVLAGRPDELWASPFGWTSRHDLPVGSPDLPAIWRASVKAEPSDELVRALVDFHRAALPSHVPDLVALLPQAKPELFPILLWQIALLASETDEHRALVARGMLYALARLRAKGVPPDPLSIPYEEHAAFLTLAEATWGLLPDGFPEEHIEAAGVFVSGPRTWIHRWAKEIRLTDADRPFLVRVAKEADLLHARVWAIRKLSEFGDLETLQEIAAGDDEAAPFADAELRRRGDRKRLDDLPAEFALRYLWYADPPAARQAWLGRFEKEQEEAKAAAENGEGRSGTGLLPEDPDETEAEWGMRISREDVAWIGEQLLAAGVPELLVPYFVDVNPDGLSRDVARRVLAALRAVEPEGISDLDQFLGLCEVRDRAAVVELLEHWAGPEDEFALLLLARLGETARAEEMIAAWDDWGLDQWALGRVRDPRVEKFLCEKAMASEPEGALDALSTFHGVANPGFSDRDEFLEADWDVEPFAGARKLLIEGKPVEAVLLLAQRDDLAEWAAATLAGSRDPLALAFLRRMRAEQWRGVYWVATAALATSGDAAAMTEFRAFVADDRTWLFDGLANNWNRWRTWSILTAGGDDALVRHWVSRINTNCCLKFHAYSTLSELFPGVPLGNEGPGDWGQKGKVVRDWFDRHAGRFRKSEILGGFVPGE